MTQTTHRRRGEAFWRRTLIAHRESGLTQADFCRRNDLALSTFQHWRRRLRLPEEEVEAGLVPDFVEIDLPSTATPGGEEGFELVFPSGLRLRLPAQVDARSLADVLWALEATGAC